MRIEATDTESSRGALLELGEVVESPDINSSHAYTSHTSMSSSQSAEATYEAQNDQRLDELHSKIRTLRGVWMFLSEANAR